MGCDTFRPINGLFVRFEYQGPGSLELAGLKNPVFLQASVLFHFVAQAMTANGRTARLAASQTDLVHTMATGGQFPSPVSNAAETHS
jgi:hypothetical protein